MKAHNTIWISALADGEVRGWRRWWLEHHLRRCTSCAAEYQQIQHVRQMLADNPQAPVLPDSPELFWSKVKREIERRGNQTITVPVPQLSWTDRLCQHSTPFAIATLVAVIVVAVAGTLWWPRDDQPFLTQAPVVIQAASGARAVWATPVPAAKMRTDTTLIWLTGVPWTETLHELHILHTSWDS